MKKKAIIEVGTPCGFEGDYRTGYRDGYNDAVEKINRKKQAKREKKAMSEKVDKAENAIKQVVDLTTEVRIRTLENNVEALLIKTDRLHETAIKHGDTVLLSDRVINSSTQAKCIRRVIA